MSCGSGVGLDQPLTCLFEAAGVPVYPHPDPLSDLYDGSIGFPDHPYLYANFVASISTT